MIRVSVFYPQTAGATFDHRYYATKHCPMVLERLRPFGCLRVEVDRGLAGGAPGSPPPYVAAAHLILESLEGFQRGWAACGAEVLADIPNYTTIAPQVQISEIAPS